MGVPVSSLALPRAGGRWPTNYATRPANTNDEDPYNASMSTTDDAIGGRMSLSCKRRNCHDRHLSSLPSLAPMVSTTRSSSTVPSSPSIASPRGPTPSWPRRTNPTARRWGSNRPCPETPTASSSAYPVGGPWMAWICRVGHGTTCPSRPSSTWPLPRSTTVPNIPPRRP